MLGHVWLRRRFSSNYWLLYWQINRKSREKTVSHGRLCGNKEKIDPDLQSKSHSLEPEYPEELKSPRIWYLIISNLPQSYRVGWANGYKVRCCMVQHPPCIATSITSTRFIQTILDNTQDMRTRFSGAATAPPAKKMLLQEPTFQLKRSKTKHTTWANSKRLRHNVCLLAARLRKLNSKNPKLYQLLDQVMTYVNVLSHPTLIGVFAVAIPPGCLRTSQLFP